MEIWLCGQLQNIKFDLEWSFVGHLELSNAIWPLCSFKVSQKMWDPYRIVTTFDENFDYTIGSEMSKLVGLHSSFVRIRFRRSPKHQKRMDDWWRGQWHGPMGTCHVSGGELKKKRKFIKRWNISKNGNIERENFRQRSSSILNRFERFQRLTCLEFWGECRGGVKNHFLHVIWGKNCCFFYSSY